MRNHEHRSRRPIATCLLALLTCLPLLGPTPAAAEVKMSPHAGDAVSGKNVKVGGKITNQLRIGRMTSHARGDGARTVLRANTIENVDVGGDLTAITDIGRVTLQAEGRDASAVMAIGTINGVSVGGDLSNTVSVGSSTNIAIGAGARACTELGTLGYSRVCCRDAECY